MSGTSAGARRGWKTRKGQLPPVSAERRKNPIRQAAGKRASETRQLRKRQRASTVYISNLENEMATRMHLRGEISGQQLDDFRKGNMRKYEEDMRYIRRRTPGRGKANGRGRR